MKYIFVFIIIFSLTSGIYIFRKLNTHSLIARLIGSFVPISLLSILNVLLSNLLRVTSDTWSQNRLATAFALIHGYRQINAIDTGPVQSWMYGPFAVVVYLPVTVFNSPIPALMAGGILNFCFFLFPVLIFCFIKIFTTKQFRLAGFSLAVFLLFLPLIIYSPPLKYSAFRIGPDAPSLCFSGLSVVALYYRYLSDKKTNISLFISSIFAVISIAIKQNLLLLPIALVIYVFLAEGVLIFYIYTFYFFISVILVSIPLMLVFDWQYLYFSMFYFPSIHPSWFQEKTSLVNSLIESNAVVNLMKKAALDLAINSLPFFLIAVSFTLFNGVKNFTNFNLQYFRIWLQKNSFLLSLWIGIFMIPIALTSRIKWGGDINSFSACVYFLMLSAVAVIVELFYSYELGLGADGYQSKIKVVLFRVVVIIVIISNLLLFNNLKNSDINSKSVFHSAKSYVEVEVAFQTMQDKSNKIFFPDFPLASLLSQGKLFHSLKGVYDRHIGRVEIGDNHLKKYLPPRF
jgi:hypothetical protein